ncbi:skin secretory protein xP2-like [Cygnus olor]|uniref:skin secretory protein xP2-like n=1 Tax=Cygnus olor TaxID=8869 RepID=UPI001ADE191C|nr:skin secretory protein xP2-like [Cygnus olor]
MLLPLAPGSCRPRGAHTSRPGQRSPRRMHGTGSIHTWCGGWIRGRGAPACPCLCFPARGSRARARPQPALGRARSAAVSHGKPGRGSTREGPSPRGIGAEPAPAATSVQGAVQTRGHGTCPQGKPGGRAQGTTKLGGCLQPGLGCMAVGLGACPWGRVRARGSGLGDGAGWGGWRVLTGTSWQQPPCLEAVLAGAEAGLCLTTGYCPGTAGAGWGRAASPGLGCSPVLPGRLRVSSCSLEDASQAPSPAQLLRGRPLPLSWAEPCSVPGPSLLPPAPAAAPARGTWPELHQAQVPLPPPRPHRAAGPGRRPAPSWEAAATPRPTRDSPADGRGRCTSTRGREGGREGCEQPLGALLYARVIYTCMLTIQEGL